MLDEAWQLLDAVWLGKTDGGVDQSFLLDMSRPVRFRSVKHRGACEFFDGNGSVYEKESSWLHLG